MHVEGDGLGFLEDERLAARLDLPRRSLFFVAQNELSKRSLSCREMEGADRGCKVGEGEGDQIVAELALHPVHDVMILRDTAREDGEALEPPPLEQGREAGLDHPAAESGPHLPARVSLLLPVYEVGLGEDAAPGRDPRRIIDDGDLRHPIVREIDPACLFVEEGSGPGRAYRVAVRVLEAPPIGQFDIGRSVAANVDDVPRPGKLPGDALDDALDVIDWFDRQDRRDELGPRPRHGSGTFEAGELALQEPHRVSVVRLVEAAENGALFAGPNDL